MRILIDTCVLSEIRNPNGNPAVKTAVLQAPDDSLFLSVLSVGEIAKGIALVKAGARRRALSLWLTGLQQQFSERILPIELETAQLWGDLTARLQTQGIIIPAVDGLLAATALQHGMHVMTRNTRHFAATSALIVDPWKHSR